MNCPYCDSRIGVMPDNRSCPHCGAPLAAFCDTAEESSRKKDDLDLEGYYLKYRPDRIRAIMALRINTGMDPVSAKTMIDFIFNRCEGYKEE